jgi:hypothetical protein
MDWVDNAFSAGSHAIFPGFSTIQGIYNYVQVKFAIPAVLTMLLAGNPASGADSAQPDAVLQGPMPGPCIAALEGPDYVPGVDANGQPVARADIGAERVPVPGDILVPLPNSGASRGGRGGLQSGRGRGQQEPAYMTLGRDRIDRLVNPPGCAAEPPRR